MTVTGLLTGQDLLQHLQGRDLGNGLLLPSLMLKQGEPVFLDDMRVEELAQALGVPIWIIGTVQDLIDRCADLTSGEAIQPCAIS